MEQKALLLAKNYLEKIRIAWEGPEDFWEKSRKFTMDSLAFKEVVTKAFVEGFTIASLKFKVDAPPAPTVTNDPSVINE